MVKLNRATEYGLMAISYMRSKTNQNTHAMTSAREIAEHFSLPFEILAKTLQRLKELGIVASTFGTRGGYVIAKDLKNLNLADFLTMMEGPSGVVACTSQKQHSHNKKSEDACCEYSPLCNIKTVMESLNHRVYAFLGQITVEELTKESPKESRRPMDEGHKKTTTPLQGEEP